MPPRRLLVAAVAAGLLLLRSLPASILRLLPPCPIHQAFGLLCPGCGATRALLALLHGDPAAAWHSNALLVLSLPMLALYVAGTALQPHRSLPHPSPRITAALTLGVLCFAVVRNLTF